MMEAPKVWQTGPHSPADGFRDHDDVHIRALARRLIWIHRLGRAPRYLSHD